MLKRSLGMIAATGALALTAGFTGTGTAAASGAGVTAACPSGAFCMYTGSNQTGAMYAKYGNWSGSTSGIKSVYNNGNRQPGYDHVNFTYTYRGNTFTRCFHYQGDDTPYKQNYVGVTAKKVVWHRAC